MTILSLVDEAPPPVRAVVVDASSINDVDVCVGFVLWEADCAVLAA